MSNYNIIYKNYQSAWGNNANPLVKRTLKFLKSEKESKALDLGCGQGRDAFFLLKNGFKVTAVDSSAVAIKQISEIAGNKKMPVRAVHGNVGNYKIKNNEYDIIIGMNVLQFLKRKEVVSLIKNIKTYLRSDGLIVLSSFTTKDPSYIKTGRKNLRYYFKPGEMKRYFKNFKLLHYSERLVMDPGHAGMPSPHKHGVVEIIAKKI